MLLFAALTVGYYFLIVAPCILIMWLLPRDVGAHLWPCASKKGIYLQLAFAFSVITSVLYSFLFRLPSLWLLIFSCFTTMLCTGMSIIALSRSRKWGRRIARSFLLGASIALALEVGVLYHAGSYLSVKWVLLNTPRPQLIISAGLVLIALAITTTTSPRVARRFGKIKVIGPLTAYTLAAGSFMLIVAALPTLAMFKLAYDHFEVKSVIRDEWLAAESLDHRSANIRKFYKDVSFGDTANEEMHRWVFLRRRVQEENLDLYDDAFSERSAGELIQPDYTGGDSLDPVSFMAVNLWHPSGSVTHFLDSGAPGQSSWKLEMDGPFRVHLYQPHAHSNNYSGASQLTALSQLASPDSAIASHELYADVQPLNPQILFGVRSHKLSGEILVCVFVVIGVISMRETLRRMFLADYPLAAKPIQDGNGVFKDKFRTALSDATQRQQSVVIMGPPCSGKTAVANEERGDTILIDLASEIDRKAAKVLSYPIAVLDHLEVMLTSSAYRAELLNILEHLLLDQQSSLVLISTVDPLFYTTSLFRSFEVPESAQDLGPDEYGRWLRILRRFVMLPYVYPGDQMSQESYYYTFISSTPLERLVLQRLAMGEWPNYRDADAILQLVKRGLVIFDPAPRFSSEEFGQFVNETFAADKEQVWTPHQQNAVWDGVKIMYAVLLLGLLATVFFLKNHEMLAYITSGFTAFTPLVKTIAESNKPALFSKGRGVLS